MTTAPPITITLRDQTTEARTAACGASAARRRHGHGGGGGQTDGGGRFDNQLRSANVKLLSFACTLEFQMKENGIIGCKYHIRHNASERDGWRHNAFVSSEEGEQWQ